MAFITQWLSQQQQADMADMVVEDTLSDLKRRSGLLDKYMPLKTYESRHFTQYVMEQIQPIASIVAPGVEPPLTQQGTFRQITAEMMKTGLARVYDETHQWAMKEAMERAAAKRILVQNTIDSNGEPVKGADNDLARYIFGSIEGIARAQIELLDYLSWQVLQTGQINYTDSRTGQTVEIDYRNPYDTTYNHFPSALTGADLWTAYTTANGLQNLYDAMETYIDTNGFAPDKIIMSRKLYNHLLQQESTKAAATQIRGASVGTVSPDMLSVTLEARGLPGIITFDEQTQTELQDKSVARTRFLNTDRFVFVKDNMGQRAMGPTLESQGRTGIYVVTREISKFPEVDATQGVSTNIIVPSNIKLFYSQKVA